MNERLRLEKGNYVMRLDVEGWPSVTPGRVYQLTRDEMCASDGCTIEVTNDKGELQVYGSNAFRPLTPSEVQSMVRIGDFTPAQTPEELIQTLTDHAFVDRRPKPGSTTYVSTERDPVILPQGERKHDAVLLPDHYARWKIEPILFIRENGLEFWQGNVIKYTMRANFKNGLEDLKKARRYLDMEIARMEGKEDWNR